MHLARCGNPATGYLIVEPMGDCQGGKQPPIFSPSNATAGSTTDRSQEILRNRPEKAAIARFQLVR